MLISVGVLAYNEAEVIGKTINSLISQSVFNAVDGPLAAARWQIVVVPNGCSDDTHERAESALAEAVGKLQANNVSYKVHSIARPGKSNAWNEFVHFVADPATDVFVMIDADIEFGHPDTIANSVIRLLEDDHARAVVDLPLKDFTRKPNPSFRERLSSLASRINRESQPGIAGSFYCAKAQTLRSVWMPIDISVEDGFLAAMISTDCFRSSPDPTRIVRAENASHYFKGLTGIGEIIRHEVRLVIGTLLNCFLCWDTLLFLTPPNSRGAGPLIRALNEEKPDWYRRMMANQIAARGRWIIPAGMVFRRFSALRGRSWSQRLIRLPYCVAAFAFDLIVFWKANRLLVSGKAIGFW
jgi:glycosyltransferase involved in cell wall biosynthesis